MKKQELAALKRQAEAALVTLKPFMGSTQTRVVRSCMRGEEKEYFFQKMIDLATLVETMPHTYQQDGKGEAAIVYLHYFAGGSGNWWIIEKDKGAAEETDQVQAFGLANLFGGPTDQDAELGYISIVELLECGAELDFHFTPKTLAELKGRTLEPEKVVEFALPSADATPAKPTAAAAAAFLANL